MAFVIDLTVDIDAPTDVVWQVITDLPRYGEWNPFVSECRSTLVPGEPIDMVVHLGPKPRRQREWMVSNIEGRELSYAMKAVPLGTLHSLRSHTLTPLDGERTRYASHFELAGWLHPVVVALLGKAMQKGFAGMTEGVQRQAESRK
ncbi:SRPBCC family protein [Nocardia sp. NPDC049149]|uniref:SRPBCC family protein n=1 Tax=Nocardia sp. NPDC049149 TaxID=3364315 RepID=UPI00371ACCF2